MGWGGKRRRKQAVSSVLTGIPAGLRGCERTHARAREHTHKCTCTRMVTCVGGRLETAGFKDISQVIPG